MDFTVQLSARLGEAALRLLIHPLFYIGIVLILLQYHRQFQLERTLFHARLHRLFSEGWRMVGWGMLSGLFVSVIMALLGTRLSPGSVYLLWGISALLISFHIRFLCMVYAAGIIGILKAAFGFASLGADAPWIGWLIRLLEQTDAAGLLALAGVLHLVEAFMIRRLGSRTASPLFVESRRGKIIGGFQLFGFWPLPLFLLVPAAGGSLHLPWDPLFGGGADSAGWSFLTVPVIIGFTERTLSQLPKEKARRSSGKLMLYSLIVIGGAVLSHFWSAVLLPVAVLSIALHELLIWYSRFEEGNRTPFFVHGDSGLKVLSVIPNSPAVELGIVPGEVIDKVNGVKVRTKDELHQAMQVNPAFCRLEIINLEGQPRFVSKAIYAGDHHLLGILLCPDQDTLYYVEAKPRITLLSAFVRTWNGLVKNEKKSEQA